MIIRIYLIWVVLIVSFSTSWAQGQRDSLLYRVETRDGNAYLGAIVEKDENVVRLRTAELGVIVIQKSNIKSIVPVLSDRLRGGRILSDNHQATRYLWQPNGYGLKQGEMYYQNIWILFNQFSVGVTDRFTLGGGMVPLFLFAGMPTPVWITPKFSVPLVDEKVNVGIGALIGTVIGEDVGSFGIAYGTTTFGSRDANFSVGVGYGFVNGQWADRPMLSLSGMIRTGERGYMLTENYFLPADGAQLALLSFGGRRMVRRVGIDFALLIPTGSRGNLFTIPILGLTVPFGKVAGSIPLR